MTMPDRDRRTPVRKSKATPDDPLLTVPDVARECQVSVRTVRRWITDGDLTAVRLGRIVRVRRADLDSFIRRSLA